MDLTNAWPLLLAVSAILVHPVTAQVYGPNSDLGLIAQLPNDFNELSVQTVTVNRYGSMCPAPTISLSSTQAFPTSKTVSASLTTKLTTQTPTPYPTFTRCTDPVCPALNNDACLDASGQTYGISCNATLTGLIAFPPKLRPRTYAATFTACLAICDAEAGCQGVSYGSIGSDCLLYGSVTGMQAQNGSISARRIASYGE